MRLFTHLSLAALVLAALFQFTVVRSVDTGAANSMAQIAQGHNAEFGGQTEASKEMIAQQRKGVLREQKHKVTTPQIAIGFMALGIVLWAVAVLRKEENIHHALNAVFLVVFCVVRWLNFL